MCAGDIKSGRGPCQGDSGGPLVARFETYKLDFWSKKGQSNKQNIAMPNSTDFFFFVISYLFISSVKCKRPSMYYLKVWYVGKFCSHYDFEGGLGWVWWVFYIFWWIRKETVEGKKDPWALVGLVSWRTAPSESFPDVILAPGHVNRVLEEGGVWSIFFVFFACTIATRAHCCRFTSFGAFVLIQHFNLILILANSSAYCVHKRIFCAVF